jgi:hypothetical protein
MNLIIEASFCEPPSEVACFRDVTLYGSVFIFEDVLVKCQKGTRSIYWKWLKDHGAHDFISQLLKEDEQEPGFKIATQRGNLTLDRITCNNISSVIGTLQALKRYR